MAKGKGITEEWLDKADEDLKYAEASLEENLEFYDQICFHLHQAAEKYLKAYVVAESLSFKKIHDLRQLLEICIKNDKDFRVLLEAVSQLNPYYIEARYPGFFSRSDKSKTLQALNYAKAVGSLVKSKLKIS